jgi:hypothetical protein
MQGELGDDATFLVKLKISVSLCMLSGDSLELDDV